MALALVGASAHAQDAPAEPQPEPRAEAPLVEPSYATALIRDVLAARSIPHDYVLYPGEGHGFRRAETIVDALERELAFLGRAFGFSPSD